MMACTSPAFTDSVEAVQDRAVLIRELDVKIVISAFFLHKVIDDRLEPPLMNYKPFDHVERHDTSFAASRCRANIRHAGHAAEAVQSRVKAAFIGRTYRPVIIPRFLRG